MGDNAAAQRFLRITPKSAPFRRAGIAFPTLDPVVFTPEDALADEVPEDDELRLLLEEPLLIVEVSEDGQAWARLELPPETGSRRKR